MVGHRVYDLFYRFWAPWDGVGVRPELRAFLDAGEVTAVTHPRAIDLGCGTGANVVHLAEQGFDAHGVDFSQVALEAARRRAREAAVADRCRFVRADLTAGPLDELPGTFDLALDFGTLDDLPPHGRRTMAELAAALVRPGGKMLFWCFYARREDLPVISFHGPSRLASAVRPGEEEELFAEHFDIAPGPPVGADALTACFVLTRL